MKTNKKSKDVRKKKKYKKPKARSEKMMTFGALCNGTLTGDRKDSAGAPNFCNAAKLLS